MFSRNSTAGLRTSTWLEKKHFYSTIL